MMKYAFWTCVGLFILCVSIYLTVFDNKKEVHQRIIIRDTVHVYDTLKTIKNEPAKPETLKVIKIDEKYRVKVFSMYDDWQKSNNKLPMYKFWKYLEQIYPETKLASASTYWTIDANRFVPILLYMKK